MADAIGQTLSAPGTGGPEASQAAWPEAPRAAEYRAALREAVQTPPQTLDFGFRVWSAARLAAYLEGQTGMALTADRARRILQEEGFSFQRPQHTSKGKRDEAAYEKARRPLNRMKKGRLRVITMQS